VVLVPTIAYGILSPPEVSETAQQRAVSRLANVIGHVGELGFWLLFIVWVFQLPSNWGRATGCVLQWRTVKDLLGRVPGALFVV
jgi:uncharacterized membrane protein